jgi:hypothetical protein
MPMGERGILLAVQTRAKGKPEWWDYSLFLEGETFSGKQLIATARVRSPGYEYRLVRRVLEVVEEEVLDA